MKKAAEAYPLKRPGTVDEIADAVVFLASDKAKFITGHMMPVDGGSTILR
jgi:NAD(P)-dependent dehydrogenase (short-subunit alcohol dehydrogenase family)